jgi:hypothetical protein
MWRRILNRAGRAVISVVAGGVAVAVSGTPYALVLTPVLSALGKWMRERGFNNVPF